MELGLLSSEMVTNWLIVLASTAFLYVSLGRATALRYEKAARLIISVALSVTGVQAIAAQWASVLLPSLGWIVAGSISALILHRVLLQRGKTGREVEEDRRREERRWQRDFGSRSDERA